MIAADSYPCSIWVLLVGSDLTYHLGVTYFLAAILWDVLILDDLESFRPGNALIFGSLRSFAYALKESAKYQDITQYCRQ